MSSAAARESEQSNPSIQEQPSQTNLAARDAFELYPIVRGIIEYCDVCTIHKIRTFNPLFERAANVFLKKKLSVALGNAVFVWRGPAVNPGMDGEGDTEEWSAECIVSTSPVAKERDGSIIYGFQLDDSSVTQSRLTTHWNILDGVDIYIPRDCSAHDFNRSGEGVHVKFFLDEEQHEMDDYIDWTEEYVDDNGDTVMIGVFTLMREDDEVEGRDADFSYFFFEEVDVKIGVKEENNYWKLWMVEFASDDFISRVE